MKDGTSVAMIVVLYTSIGVGYVINGTHGVFIGLIVTFAAGIILSIGFLGLIIQNHREKRN